MFKVGDVVEIISGMYFSDFPENNIWTITDIDQWPYNITLKRKTIYCDIICHVRPEQIRLYNKENNMFKVGDKVTLKNDHKYHPSIYVITKLVNCDVIMDDINIMKSSILVNTRDIKLYEELDERVYFIVNSTSEIFKKNLKTLKDAENIVKEKLLNSPPETQYTIFKALKTGKLEPVNVNWS